MKKACFIFFAIVFGLFSAVLCLDLADTGFGYWKGSGDASSWYYREPAQNIGKTNREILGLEATTHGIFPATPSPASKREIEKEISDTSLHGREQGHYRNLPFPLPVVTNHLSIQTSNGQVLKRFDYTVDAFARRVTPGEEKKRAKQYYVLTGCSYTFGEGLADDQTLAYYLGQKLPRTRVYNYGIPGASPGENWLRLKIVDQTEIPEVAGTVTYMFINDHINRTRGSLSMRGSWGKLRTHFFRDKDGAIQADGTFLAAEPIRTKLYIWLMKKNILNYYAVDYPFHYSQADFSFFADVVNELKKTAEQKLHAKKFVVIFYPGERLSTRVIPSLERLGISYIDYSHWDITKLVSGSEHAPYDGHPSAEANQVLADAIYRDLFRD